ncbi:hypothetical protein [Mycobacterium phage WXIN]|nr:hypothetical protein [Mycobacterium phage WXIN]
MTLHRRVRPVDITDAPEHRAIPLDRVEIRDDSDDNTLTLEGYASTFEPYEMYGGPGNGYGWTEQLDREAFDKTLREKPDLHLLVNHAGMPLARTKSGTLDLSVDDGGLKVVARLDRRDPEVQSLAVKMERGDMDEMSFAFRVKAQKWEATDEHPDDNQALRTITEVSLHKGDVSVVNFGANPTTSVGLRSVSEALKVIAECDEDELVEARSNEALVRKAAEKLSPARHAVYIENLNAGVMTPDEARAAEAGEDFAKRVSDSMASSAPALPVKSVEIGDGKEEEREGAKNGTVTIDVVANTETLIDQVFEAIRSAFAGLPIVGEALVAALDASVPDERGEGIEGATGTLIEDLVRNQEAIDKLAEAISIITLGEGGEGRAEEPKKGISLRYAQALIED